MNKHDSAGLKRYNDSKVLIAYSNDMYDIYENIDEYNPNKKSKILIVFDDKTADRLNNKKLNLIVTELFLRGKKTKHFSCFYTILFCCTKKILNQILHTISL